MFPRLPSVPFQRPELSVKTPDGLLFSSLPLYFGIELTASYTENGRAVKAALSGEGELWDSDERLRKRRPFFVRNGEKPAGQKEADCR